MFVRCTYLYIRTYAHIHTLTKATYSIHTHITIRIHTVPALAAGEVAFYSVGMLGACVLLVYVLSRLRTLAGGSRGGQAALQNEVSGVLV